MGWSCGKIRDEKLAKRADIQKGGGEIEARKSETAMGDYIKSDLERVGQEWKSDRYEELETAERTYEKGERKKKDPGKGNDGELTLDDSDAKKTNAKATIILNP